MSFEETAEDEFAALSVFAFVCFFGSACGVGKFAFESVGGVSALAKLSFGPFVVFFALTIAFGAGGGVVALETFFLDTCMLRAFDFRERCSRHGLILSCSTVGETASSVWWGGESDRGRREKRAFGPRGV